MEFKFFANQSSPPLSIINMQDTSLDKLTQGSAVPFTPPALQAKNAKKQKAWPEAHRWLVVLPRTNMIALSLLAVAADG
jgi:hypothetical protein